MGHRLALILVTAFWLLMNALLWRAEYGARGGAGSPVPAQFIWHRMLTAPDSSSLSILHHGKKIGFCHWVTSVAEEMSQLQSDAAPPEGMVRRATGYHVQLDGNAAVEEMGAQLRFDGAVSLATNHVWQDFNARLIIRPFVLEVRGDATQKTVSLRAQSERGTFSRVFSLENSAKPEQLLPQVIAAVAVPPWDELGAEAGALGTSASVFPLKWEGRQDSVTIGHSPVRAYRLQAQIMEKYRVVIFTSRVGEILRVELPHNLVLVNDQLASP